MVREDDVEFMNWLNSNLRRANARSERTYNLISLFKIDIGRRMSVPQYVADARPMTMGHMLDMKYITSVL
jgi:hypothetical protein